MKSWLSRRWRFAVFGVAAVIATGCGSDRPDDADRAGGSDDIEVAYVTNGIAVFWDIAAAGAKAAGEELDVAVDVKMPPKGIVDQTQMVEDLLVRGIDGIAISPIDAENQTGFLNEVAEETILITQDSDAPDSARLCFVGMDNYKAGRAAGKLVKEVMPEGGSVAIFVGRLEQLNARQRRQGVIDELLDRPVQQLDAVEFDPPDARPSGEKYSIVDTRTDNFDFAQAKANAEDMIVNTPELGCMVGLFAYNTPLIIEAVREADKLNEIQIVSFDEADETLEGIQNGYVHGTVSQQPYLYGHHSVRILAGLARGDESVLPEGDMLEVPFVVVRKDNVDAFWAELKELAGN